MAEASESLVLGSNDSDLMALSVRDLMAFLAFLVPKASPRALRAASC